MKFEDKGNVIFSFSANHPPVAELIPGEVLVVETADCFNGQIDSSEQEFDKIDLSKINPATGPFYIPGAEAGDALAVEILEINPKERGIMVVAPNMGVLGGEIETPVIKVIKLTGTNAVIAENLSVPIQPMVGVIGVAPEEGEVGCGRPGIHGGNLDTKEIRPGSKVYLPVFHHGALLALGDVHALMGDGEISGTGIEVSAEVKICVQVMKEANLALPRVETSEGLFFLASAEKLEAAVQTACQAGVRYLQEEAGLSFSDAYMAAGAACQLRISQVVNPLFTVKFFVPSFLKALHE